MTMMVRSQRQEPSLRGLCLQTVAIQRLRLRPDATSQARKSLDCFAALAMTMMVRWQ